MKHENTRQRMKWGAALLALTLAVAVPFAAPAQSANQGVAADTTSSATVQMPSPQRGGQGPMFGGSNVNLGSLTGKQMTAYESAIALYEQVEDAVLADLVAAGVVTKADVDNYTALRAERKSLAEIDQTTWTARQYKAYFEANALTGDERKAAMQALADAGQITQAQADALTAQDQPDLWAKIIRNAGANPAIQKAISTMQQAQAALNNALRNAGIVTMGNGTMVERPGMGGGQGRNRDDDFGRDEDGEDD